MFKNILLTISTVWILFCLSGCESDPVVVLEPQQSITLLTYTLTPEGGGQPVVFSFEDEDGNGGSNGIATGGTLDKSTTYSGEVEVFAMVNDSMTNITEAIRLDGRDNQFFYTVLNPALLITYDDADVDADGNPIGILTNLNTVNNSGEGNVILTLKHNPDKDGISVSNGNVSLSGGRTDFEIEFPVVVVE